MTIPVFRIFDYDKAIEFYIGFLGFKLDWEHRPADAPAYMQVSKDGIVLHLSEHHGDGTPGSKAMADFRGLQGYHAELLAKNYAYNRPGLEVTPWDANGIYVEVIDPFQNRLVFTERTRS